MVVGDIDKKKNKRFFFILVLQSNLFDFILEIENQQLLLNSYASCRRLLDHMKQVVGIHQDGKMIDFYFQIKL
jgi:hypothetical protein